jgi:hypothetical protein
MSGNDDNNLAPVAIQPAPVAVQPAPVAVQPAPVAVQPAPIVLQPAPIAYGEGLPQHTPLLERKSGYYKVK